MGKQLPHFRLTDAKIRDALPVERPAKMFDGGGLFLLIPPSGSKWWRLKYRFRRRENQLSLGVYPQVGLTDARERRDAVRKLLADGIDPSEYRKAERARNNAEQVSLRRKARFSLNSHGALSFRLVSRSLTLTPDETVELRVFLDATREVIPKVTPCS